MDHSVRGFCMAAQEPAMTDAASALRHYLEATDRFQSYLYSYPHKAAYRAFEHKLDLKTLWEPEKKHALYLYTHIPFCRMKCSFCNLFTVSHPKEDLVRLYLDKVRLEA